MSGTEVGHIDEIDLYECLEREPDAVHYFYRADEALKRALVNKDSTMAIKAMEELIHFVAEMALEDYPHSRTKVCKAIDNGENNFTHIKRIVEKLKDPETTLRTHEDHLEFNHHDISENAKEWVDDYLNGQWMRLGWNFGRTLDLNSHHITPPSPPGPRPDPKREYFEKMGAQFAAGFLAGTEVGEVDEIDLYECLHREPTAVEYFYKADRTLKEGWIKKDSHEAVQGIDDLLKFIVELVLEDYPHSKTQVCKEF